MRFLIGILITAALIATPYLWWHAQSEGLVDNLPSISDAGPTPTAPVSWADIGEEDSRDQTWSDRWVVFAHKPHVCEGVLRVKGQPQNGASVSYGAADAAPFALYRRSELAPRHGYIAPPAVKPIVSFVEPLTGGEYYSHLDRNEVVADVLRTDGTDEFELVAEWPVWLVESRSDSLRYMGLSA